MKFIFSINFKLLFVAFYSFLPTSIILCQNNSVIQGRVINQYNNPISGAIIIIKEASQKLSLTYGLSNSNGYYFINHNIKDSTFFIEYKFLGYKTILAKIENQKKVLKNVQLLADTVELNNIILNTRQPILISGDTTSFRVEYFKQGYETNIGELLSNMPGFSIVNGRIKYNERIVDRVLIEGDDLFGKDYSVITNSVSPNGLDKIDLVKNFSDKAYLKNSIDNKKEQVVNLRFKSSINKIFGNQEIGSNIKTENSLFQGNIISLIPKVKFVSTFNKNNTGNLANEILNKNTLGEQLNLKSEQSIDFDITKKIFNNLQLSLPEFQTNIIHKKDYNFNKTSLITNNILYKPSPLLFFKNIVQLYTDHVNIFNSREEKYTLPGITPFFYTEISNLNKTNKFISVTNEASYFISKKNQILIKSQYISDINNGSSVGIVQGNTINQGLKNSIIDFRNQFSLVSLFTEKSILEINVQYCNGKSTEYLNLSQANIFEKYTYDSVYENLNTQIKSLTNEYDVEMKFERKTKKGSFYFLTNYSKGNNSFVSGINLYNILDQQIQPINDSLKNNNKYKFEGYYFVFDLKRKIAKKIDFELINRLEKNKVIWSNQIFNNTGEYTKYLPSLNLTFKINEINQLVSTFQLNYKLPNYFDLIPNYLIINNKNIVKGLSEITTSSNNSLSLLYYYTELKKRKILFNSGLIINQNYIGTIENSFVDYYYSTRIKELYNNKINAVFAFINYEKYYRIVKSTFKLNFSFNDNKSNFKNRDQLFEIKFNSFNYGFNIKSLLTKSFTLGFGAKFLEAHQITSNFHTETKNSQRLSKFTFDFNLHLFKRITLNGNYDFIESQQSTMSNKISLGAMLIKFNFKNDKSNLSVSINNIFNNYSLLYFSVTPFSTVSENVKMIPRYLLFKYSFTF